MESKQLGNTDSCLDAHTVASDFVHAEGGRGGAARLAGGGAARDSPRRGAGEGRPSSLNSDGASGPSPPPSLSNPAPHPPPWRERGELAAGLTAVPPPLL